MTAIPRVGVEEPTVRERRIAEALGDGDLVCIVQLGERLEARDRGDAEQIGVEPPMIFGVLRV